MSTAPTRRRKTTTSIYYDDETTAKLIKRQRSTTAAPLYYDDYYYDDETTVKEQRKTTATYFNIDVEYVEAKTIFPDSYSPPVDATDDYLEELSITKKMQPIPTFRGHSTNTVKYSLPFSLTGLRTKPTPTKSSKGGSTEKTSLSPPDETDGGEEVYATTADSIRTNNLASTKSSDGGDGEKADDATRKPTKINEATKKITKAFGATKKTTKTIGATKKTTKAIGATKKITTTNGETTKLTTKASEGNKGDDEYESSVTKFTVQSGGGDQADEEGDNEATKTTLKSGENVI